MPKVASLIAFNDEGGFFLAAATSAEVFANRAAAPVVALDGDMNAVLVAGKDSSSRSRDGMVAVAINCASVSSTVEELWLSTT